MDRVLLAKEVKALLEERFPGKYNFTSALAEILNVHIKTVQSRLRGDTEFTITELYKIARHFAVPIGNIFSKAHGSKHPMEIHLQDFSVREDVVPALEKTLQVYNLAASSACSTYMSTANTIPHLVFCEHEWITKFEYIKWLYFNKGRNYTLPMSEVVVTKSDRDILKRHLESIKAFKRSVYILNFHMMRFIADELTFFYNIRLITKGELGNIIGDYSALVDEIEELCNSGNRIGSKKEVNVLFSHILLSNDITLVKSDELNFAIIYAYFHNPILSKDARTFEVILNWFNSWLNSGNVISVSDPVQRLKFFQNQREYIKALQNNVEI